MYNCPSFFEFSSVIRSQCRVNVYFFDPNFCFKSQIWTLRDTCTARVVPDRRAIAPILRKAVPLARVTLPAEAKQLAHSSCLAPDGFALVEFCKEIS